MAKKAAKKAEAEPKAAKAAKAEKPTKAEKPVKAEKAPVKKEAAEKKTSKSKSEVPSGQADPIWMELQRKHGEEKALAYDMKNQYQASTSLNHKILGWGWILSNENDRLEVVFKDGKRVLISNYKK